jgi:hypothetical protein
MTGLGHFYQFSTPNLSDDFLFGQETFVRPTRNGQDAPKAVHPEAKQEPPCSEMCLSRTNL